MTVDENQIFVLSPTKDDVSEHKSKARSQKIVGDMHEHEANRVQHDPCSSSRELVPIHRLPPEILSPIFMDILGTAIWCPRTQLSGVCRRWRDVVNGMKCLWNEILIRDLDRSKGLGTERIYPCPQYLQTILERARGSPIKLRIRASVKNYEWIFEILEGFLDDISQLILWPPFEYSFEPFMALCPIIRQMSFPSLRYLGIAFDERRPTPASFLFVECFLQVATSSRMRDQLALRVCYQSDCLLALFKHHDAFIKARDLTLSFEGDWPPLYETFTEPMSLPNLYHLNVDNLEYFLEHLDAPKLRSLTISYGGGMWSSQLAKLKPIASQLEVLDLNLREPMQPLSEGCPVPLPNLAELIVWRVPPPSSGSHLLLSPNLEYLRVCHWHERNEPVPTHCLAYMLGAEGMLGPIRALKRLHIDHLILKDHSHADYCTRYLGLHRNLEELALEGCEVPRDFLELMLKPLGAPNDFLPELKILILEDCSSNTQPSGEWFAQLSITRPNLKVTCFRTPK
ncbi:hypothetical protein CPB86DRAFT_828651 [Serendipita vermifera]|nr:hypothetical protein CPB86DRAFT_828651 [Serendipita vermifera]